jgi:hypothetical protein
MKTTLTAAALALCASAAHAQVLSVRPLPATGELIRVTPASGEPFTGRVAALGGDTLMLAGDPGVRVVASQQRVEILRSRRERWSVIGAFVGLAAGVAVNAARGSSTTPHGLSQGVVSGAGGAVLGGVVGFAVAPHRWQPLRATLPLPPPSVTARREPGRR